MNNTLSILAIILGAGLIFFAFMVHSTKVHAQVGPCMWPRVCQVQPCVLPNRCSH